MQLLTANVLGCKLYVATAQTIASVGEFIHLPILTLLPQNPVYYKSIENANGSSMVCSLKDGSICGTNNCQIHVGVFK